MSLNDTLDQTALTDTYRTFHPKQQNIRSFQVHVKNSLRCNKTSLIKFKKIEMISCIFSDHNGMKLEINYNFKKWKKKKTIWRLNNKQKQKPKRT